MRKAGNLLLFGFLLLCAILAKCTYDLYDLARVPRAHHAMNELPKGSGASKLADHVRALAVDIGTRNYAHAAALEKAAAFVSRELESYGYALQTQEYEVRPPDAPAFKAKNFIAAVPASAPNAPILVIGAHYDTVSTTPGADDNASGTAVLLELARRFRGRGGKMEIRFVTYCTEEPPFFGTAQMGSAVHARSLKAEGRDVAGMISLEMLGFYADAKGSQKYPPPLSLFYPDRGNFLGMVSNLHSRKFLKAFEKGYQAPNGLPKIATSLPQWIGEIELSDQLNYWEQGFPAAMITDTAFLRNPNYHLPGDTIETLDFERMADATNGLEAAIRAFTESR